eukprot:SAG31_NODE_1268_length_9068_cov_6.241164_3_plen_85_part_00
MHENPLAHASASPSVGILKEGTLFKLGGQHRDKWQARRFRLTDSSLEWEVRGYFLVFVQLFEKHGSLIERYTALIEKVSALIGH